MSAPDTLAAAEARANEARARLNDTVGSLQQQLAPATLAKASADTLKRNPAVIVGGIALVAALLGRKQIAAAVKTAGAKAKQAATNASSKTRAVAGHATSTAKAKASKATGAAKAKAGAAASRMAGAASTKKSEQPAPKRRVRVPMPSRRRKEQA